MSKRELRKYLHKLPKEELEEQVLDLYAKFKNVKTYYDFVFNPDEAKLVEEAKFKIRKEYFPASNRKPKARRSVAQKYIRHFITLGVEPQLIADLMLYNIETAIAWARTKIPRQESFYFSMLKSYREASLYLESNKLQIEFQQRLQSILENVEEQNWFNLEGFHRK